MSGVQPPGSGVPRNPAVGFADILRQSAPGPAPDLASIMRPNDFGTPIPTLGTSRPRESQPCASNFGKPFGSGLSAFVQTREGLQVSAEDAYARSIALGLGRGAGLYSGTTHSHPRSQQVGSGVGLLGGAELLSASHSAAQRNGASLELLLQQQVQSSLSLLGGSRQVDTGPYFGENPSFGRLGQFQPTANPSVSMQLAQLLLQAQQLQRSQHFGTQAAAPRPQAVPNGILHPGSAFTAVSSSATSTESHLMALLRQSKELNQAEAHATSLRGQLLNLGHLDLEQLVAGVPALSSFIDPRIAAMRQQAVTSRSDSLESSQLGANQDLGAWSGKVPFSAVLARREDPNARMDRQFPVFSSLLQSDLEGDHEDTREDTSEASGLMTLAKYAQLETMHMTESVREGKESKTVSTKNHKSNSSAGKRRKQARIPKLAGPVTVDGRVVPDAKESGHQVACDDEEQRDQDRETASALLAISNAPEAKGRERQRAVISIHKSMPSRTTSQAEAEAAADGEALDPHKLLLHLQTHTPPEEEDDEVADIESKENDEEHVNASSDDDAAENLSEDEDATKTAVTRKRSRSSVSIFRKEDKFPKRLAPKAEPLASKAGGARNERGLVRVPRSSLFKKQGEAGREIGVKGEAGRPVGVKDATPDTSPSQMSNELSSKGPECTGDRKLKKLSAVGLNLNSEGSADASPRLSSALCSVRALGIEKRDTREMRKVEPSADQAAINKLAKRLTDLADRIPYTGVLDSDPQVWTKFNTAMEKVTKVSDICKQWIWLARQIKPDMLLAKWLEEHHKEWTQNCQECETAEQLHVLIKEFSTNAIDWALASQRFLMEKGQMSAARQTGTTKKLERAPSSTSININQHQSTPSSQSPDGVLNSKSPKLMDAKFVGKSEEKRKKVRGHATSAPSADSCAKPGTATPKPQSSAAQSSAAPAKACARRQVPELPSRDQAGETPGKAGEIASQVTRAWRYRKGRWMYVVVKDDAKKPPVRFDASMTVEESSALEDQQELVAVKSEEIGSGEGSVSAGAAVGETAPLVKKPLRRRKGRLTMPPKKRSVHGGKRGNGGGASHKLPALDQRRVNAAHGEAEGTEGNRTQALDKIVDEESEGSISGDRGMLLGKQAGAETVKATAVKPLRKMLHSLVRRIHYTAFVCQDRDVWHDFHKMVDKCTDVRDLCERLVWASQNLLQRMMKSKWKTRRKQWVRDCRGSRNTADFKLRCREFRLHVDWEAVDASVSTEGHSAGMRLGGASYAGRRDTDAGAGALGVGVVRDADTTCSAEEGSEGGGQGCEAMGNVIEDDGGDQKGGGSQRSVHGIVEMRQIVNRLVRRIHYSAFACPSKETWVSYHRSVGRSVSAAEVAERLVWAVRQLLPGMVRPSWLPRRKKWEERCLGCRDKNALRLLKFELEKYAINWEAVEASTRAFEAGEAASNCSLGGSNKPVSRPRHKVAKKEKELAGRLHGKTSSFKAKVPRDERSGSRSGGSYLAPRKRNGGADRDGRYMKRRRFDEAAGRGPAEAEGSGGKEEREFKEEHVLAASGDK